MSKIKKSLTWLACAVLAFACLLPCLGFSAARVVNADTPTDYEKVEISENQFDASGSIILKTLNSWEPSYIGDFAGEAISGVVDLSTDSGVSYTDFMEETKLDAYSEFADAKPTTPFGRNTNNPNGNLYFPGTNSKALMINTNDTDSKRGTAYGYSSEDIELDAYSYYKFSVWAKTGDFVQDTGAVIKISGLDYDIGFWNIDNSEEINNATYGFTEYVIFVATAENSASVKLNLQVGDCYTYGTIDDGDSYIEHIHPSSGYAFFDNITCTKLSANAYAHEASNSGNVMVCDFNTDLGKSVGVKSITSLTSRDGVEMGSFEGGMNGWEIIDEEGTTGTAYYVDVYDASKAFDDENIEGIIEEPYTPNGTHAESNVLALVAKSEAKIGVESDEIVIERNKFYRLSVWAKAQGFGDDGNASLVIVGESNIPASNNELSPVVINDAIGSDDINTRYGWAKYHFYIRGSLSKDCAINLQLWLGYEELCTGVALFDQITLEEITYANYNANNSLGTIVTFENAPATSMTNGRFYDAENFDNEYPLTPAEWNTVGNTDNDSVSGVVLTNEEHYNANISTYLNVANPVSSNKNVKYNSTSYPSMLLLASENNSYFGYASPSISLTNGSDYKVSVTMRTIGMTGAGANIWLEVNGKTVAAVKNIGSTADFETYEFYLQGDVALTDGTGIDYTTTLNITLGNAKQKATGSIFVLEAAFQNLDEGAFATKYEQFKSERTTGIKYDMYSFSSLDFFGYDNSDTNAIKASTSWSVTESASDESQYEAGVFDPNNKTNNNDNAYIPAEITEAYNSLEFKADLVYTLQARNTALTAQLVNPLKLEANSYYMITVSMAVIMKDGVTATDNEYGASLYLSGNETYEAAKFEKLKSTQSLVYGYEFRDYQFYVATSNEATTVYLRAALGNIAYPNRYVTGDLYIANISLVNLGSSEEGLIESDTLRIIDASETIESEEETTPEEETAPVSDSEKWWVIPSILLGVAILIAIIGIVIRTLAGKASRRKHKHNLSSYDRRLGLVENPQEDIDLYDEDTIVAEPVKEINPDIEKFNDFDDDNTPDVVIEEKVAEQEAPAITKVEKSNDEPINEFED
ncbi:MAG: hypothetical protein IKC48_02870 [Clostridia bacterium]|nr:hypothetical protein [Clostridia bacterium]